MCHQKFGQSPLSQLHHDPLRKHRSRFRTLLPLIFIPTEYLSIKISDLRSDLFNRRHQLLHKLHHLQRCALDLYMQIREIILSVSH
ncbi:hypothetical protein Y030_4201 [Burkholderia pseudomallei MSHR332]|nr:hypothetical protein Y030_4201 [Burkholderia pseudomallei MSHR332]